MYMHLATKKPWVQVLVQSEPPLRVSDLPNSVLFREIFRKWGLWVQCYPNSIRKVTKGRSALLQGHGHWTVSFPGRDEYTKKN